MKDLKRITPYLEIDDVTEVLSYAAWRDEEVEMSLAKNISLGLLEGKIKLPDDFNDPLEDLADYR